MFNIRRIIDWVKRETTLSIRRGVLFGFRLSSYSPSSPPSPPSLPHWRVRNAFSQEKPDVGCCGVCMEDGKLRECCRRHYCKLCYEGTGNCPGCQRIMVGANLGVLADASAVGMKSKNVVDGIAQEVRDGEECRSCLRQGFYRKCCGEFYCSDCYFKSGYCPSCQCRAERRVKYQRFPRDPGLVPVLVGYLATLLVCLAALTCIAVIAASNHSLPRTMFGQTCFGFFSKCTTGPKCIAFDGNLAHGLNPVSGWSACDDESTVMKIYGSYCVFDKQVCAEGKYIFH